MIMKPTNTLFMIAAYVLLRRRMTYFVPMASVLSTISLRIKKVIMVNLCLPAIRGKRHTSSKLAHPAKKFLMVLSNYPNLPDSKHT